MVVGVSGGADSTALLHALLKLNQEHGYSLELHVAHLNHALRASESDEDAAFVEAAADALELPRTVETRDIPYLMQSERGSIEEVARRERYAFFEKTCLAEGIKIIALGHHADDNAETVLHRIIRGTGLRGVGGIVPARPIRRRSDIIVVRPQLRFSRQEIQRFLTEEGLIYRDDSSNAALDTTRNRIRHDLLPHLESEFNPQVRDALLRLAEQAQWASEYVRSTVQKTFETLVISRTDQELVLNAAALARKDRIVQTELVRAAVSTFEIGEQDLTFGHLKSVTDLIAEPVSGKRVTLPGGMSARIVYNRLVISMPTEEPRESIAEQVAVHVPGKTVLPIRRMEIECELFRLSEDEIAQKLRNQDRFEEWLDAEKVRLPLVVRSRQPGDRFWPLGAPGSKKLADFLSDMKVDPEEREKIAVLCDQLGAVWMIGHRIDDRVKLTRVTRDVIRVRARMLDD
jgi:tRNA(Ile)-lysidine synthase